MLACICIGQGQVLGSFWHGTVAWGLENKTRHTPHAFFHVCGRALAATTEPASLLHFSPFLTPLLSAGRFCFLGCAEHLPACPLTATCRARALCLLPACLQLLHTHDITTAAPAWQAFLPCLHGWGLMGLGPGTGTDRQHEWRSATTYHSLGGHGAWAFGCRSLCHLHAFCLLYMM